MRSWECKHERVEIYFFLSNFRFWPRERDPESLLFSDVCPVPSTLKVERNPTTGELLGYNKSYPFLFPVSPVRHLVFLCFAMLNCNFN